MASGHSSLNYYIRSNPLVLFYCDLFLQALAETKSEVAALKLSLEAAQESQRISTAEAEARAKDLSEHNSELHRQIEKLAEENQQQVKRGRARPRRNEVIYAL